MVIKLIIVSSITVTSEFIQLGEIPSVTTLWQLDIKLVIDIIAFLSLVILRGSRKAIELNLSQDDEYYR